MLSAIDDSPPQPRLPNAAVLLFLLLLADSATAAVACRNAPVSTLRIYTVWPAATEEVSASYGEIDRIARHLDLPAARRAIHPLMLITIQIDTHVAITPRILELQSDGEMLYCNAPTVVAIGFGVIRRRIFLADTAAAVPCVRGVLLAHAAEHSRALNSEVETYIRQTREEFRARVKELKRTPAPDPTSAVKAFNSGLATFLFDLVERFKAQTEPMQEAIDTPSRLEALRNACGGKVRQMEQELISPSDNRHADDTYRMPQSRADGSESRERRRPELQLRRVFAVSDPDQ
jgi:hypothetical protein